MADNKKPSKTVPPQSVPQPLDEKAAFFDHQSGAFFRKLDWGAFWTTFLITLGVYCYTLAPTVTLEDSGELAVGSDYLGVPHPPGYPSWTLFTWFFQWIFGWVRYYGNPNPAWGVALASAFFGALACGILALLVSRSGADMLRSVKRTTDVIGLSTESLLCWVGGVSGGLLLAFSPVLWSQSVIVEVYALNAFFQMLILLLTYMWMCRPKEDKLLYITAFLFGFGITNHQTLLFVGPALVAAIWFRDRALFRDCLAGLFVCVAAYLFWSASTMTGNLPPEALRSKNLTTTMALVFLLAPVGLFLIERKLMTEWKRVLLIGGLSMLGLGFNGFMPISSDQNPPINWGYPRTPEGFKHAITRGQYEKITVSDIFSAKFLAQLGAYFSDLQQQFTLPIAHPRPGPVLLHREDRPPRAHVADHVAGRLRLAQHRPDHVPEPGPGHPDAVHRPRAVHPVARRLRGLAGLRRSVCAGLPGNPARRARRRQARWAWPPWSLLPLTLLYQNAFDKEQIKIVGGAEQNQHDFGWQFGNWELQGVDGIRSDLSYKKTPDGIRDDLEGVPDPELPAADGNERHLLRRHRSRTVRPDLHDLLRQGAARRVPHHAERPRGQHVHERHARPLRRHDLDPVAAGQQLRVPEVRRGRAGRAHPGGRGRAVRERPRQRAGRAGRHDDQRHPVPDDLRGEQAEARVLRRGKLRDPVDVPLPDPQRADHEAELRAPAVAVRRRSSKNDRDFWDWYTKRLLEQSQVHCATSWPGRPSPSCAARSRASTRSGACTLRPNTRSSRRSTSTRSARRPTSAWRMSSCSSGGSPTRGKLIEQFLHEDPGNSKVRDFLNQIQETEKADARRVQLEAQFNQGQGELNTAMELADLYRKLNMEGQFQGLTMNILNDTNIPPNAYLAIAKMYADSKRMDLLAVALEKYLAREPANPKVWIDLAAIQAAMQKSNDCMQSLKRAIDLGGEPVRDIIRKDPRFNPIRESPEFKALVPSIQQQGLPMNLPNLPML